MTTSWVLDGSCGNFPMLYHWRVLPGAPPVASDAEARDERVAFWGGSAAVARRLEAIADATAGVVFDNIVTDGRGLHFTDFGLASSSRFDLTPAETEFVDRHRLHDVAYTMTELVNWLVREVVGVPEWADRIEYLPRRTWR